MRHMLSFVQVKNNINTDANNSLSLQLLSVSASGSTTNTFIQHISRFFVYRFCKASKTVAIQFIADQHFKLPALKVLLPSFHKE